MMAFTHWTTGSTAPWPLRKRKPKVSPTVIPAYWVEVVSRPHSTGRGNPNWAQWPCWVGKDRVRGGEDNYNLQVKIPARWELHREKSGALQCVPNLWLRTYLCVCGGNCSSPEKDHCKRVSRNLQSSHRAGISSDSHQPEWKDLINAQGLRVVEPSEGYCFPSGAKGWRLLRTSPFKGSN